ncbi:hypothetical protein TSUD_148600 [Trifolium subterraneum]|uniref:Aminotransferase-like plant mobile domain-containing protein n=1 Tax=Trifolium subterraneum TaxID=3900 RepID=A0A2Z6NQ30_TRISU|nr:hypothetical protein TSUD_148600 [Trifolium subterraneum]
MPTGEFTVTMDDVCRLLHLPVKGCLRDHTCIPTKSEGIELIKSLIGSTEKEATHEIKTTKGAHARAYLLLLFGTTIFSNKAKNNVGLTYLKYFRELMDQAWIYDHFEDIDGSLNDKYEPTKGQSTQLIDRLLRHDITWTPYEDDRDVCPFEDIALYSGWIRCGPIKVIYLPEQVLQQFDYVQTILRYPYVIANILTTVDQIYQHWRCYTNRVLTFDMFGSRATIPSNTAPGYMTWYFKIPHPYIVPIPAGQSVMHAESGDGVLGRLASIRDILNDLIISDEVPNGSHVYKELESAYTLTFFSN